MGSRDHSCETCGRGGMNDDRPCVCLRNRVLISHVSLPSEDDDGSAAEIARLRADNERLAAERDALAERCERMRAVVEAAERQNEAYDERDAKRAGHRGDHGPADPKGYDMACDKYDFACADTCDAVDVYRSGTPTGGEG